MIRIIHTKDAPKVIGPYAQAVDIGNIIFISGQLPICPKSNQIVTGIIDQTNQTLNNIKNIVKAAGLKVNNIIKTTVYVADIIYLSKINTIYEAFFIQNNAPFPSRSCIEVSRLPRNAKIEIEALAVRT